MSHCTYCWKPSIVEYKDVSKFWNNEKGTGWVCSEECYKATKESLKRPGGWMEWNDKMREYIPKRSGLDK